MIPHSSWEFLMSIYGKFYFSICTYSCHFEVVILLLECAVGDLPHPDLEELIERLHHIRLSPLL